MNQELKGTFGFSGPQCRYCKKKGSVVYIGWQRYKDEHGFGVVVRQETKEVARPVTLFTQSVEQSTTMKEERAPVVRTTWRYYYRCNACKAEWYTTKETQYEDFAPPATQAVIRENSVYTREVVKVPCKFCGMLVDPVRDQKCSSCGANLSIGR